MLKFLSDIGSQYIRSVSPSIKYEWNNTMYLCPFGLPWAGRRKWSHDLCELWLLQPNLYQITVFFLTRSNLGIFVVNCLITVKSQNHKEIFLCLLTCPAPNPDQRPDPICFTMFVWYRMRSNKCMYMCMYHSASDWF